jgi:HD-like signal output (HDOD) protein
MQKSQRADNRGAAQPFLMTGNPTDGKQMIQVKNILKKVKELKPVPTIVHKVLDLAQDPESSLSQIVDLISYEPAITSNLLKICNSAYMGLSVKVDSVHQAVSMLGLERVVEMVLTQNLSTNMNQPQKGYALAKGELWSQSVATAMVARSLSERRQLDHVAAIYTAALLKDIGKVILNEYVERMALRIQRMVAKKGVSFAEAEMASIGMDHATLGGIIAKEWNFSGHMVYMIENHHMLNSEARNDPATGAIYLADMVAMMVGTGIGVDRLAYTVYESVFTDYFMTRDELKALMFTYSGCLEGAKRMFDSN